MLVSINDFTAQPQTIDTEVCVTEGVSNNTEDHLSDVGREKGSETEASESIESARENGVFDLNYTIDLNETETKIRVNSGQEESSSKKNSEGIKWHRKLGHASLRYLRKMKDNTEALKNVKLKEDTLDCSTCKMQSPKATI